MLFLWLWLSVEDGCGVVVAVVVEVAVVVVVVGCWRSSFRSSPEPLSLILSETELFHFRSSGGALSTSIASFRRSCPIADVLR